LHSFEDIPVLMGLTENVRLQGVRNPHTEDGRRLWYATAIGTEPAMVDVILAQVESVQVQFSGRIAGPFPSFTNELSQGRQIGQVEIRPTGSGYELRHIDDHAAADDSLRAIRAHRNWSAWREIIRMGNDGKFRPLKAAPNLQRGWRLILESADELQLALEYLYPAALANWRLAREGKLPLTPYNETAWRQSGRYHIVRTLEGAALTELIGEVCEAGCSKKRLWKPHAGSLQQIVSQSESRNEVPLLCPEACNYFIGKARQKIKGVREED
jgi:sirohydrochlorin cobaltochelatase